jgi:hypothetical protein
MTPVPEERSSVKRTTVYDDVASITSKESAGSFAKKKESAGFFIIIMK